ncbi:MAG: hypothetical protein U0599_04115 [Vicinamibacteria bacterium]
MGLPIPAGAAQVAAIVFVMPGPPTQSGSRGSVLVLVVALGFLMVSTFRYRSFRLRPAAAAQPAWWCWASPCSSC